MPPLIVSSALCVSVLLVQPACVSARSTPPVMVTSPPPMIFSGTPAGVPPQADCAIRRAAWAFGRSLQPRKGAYRSLFDALQLQSCGDAVPPRQDHDPNSADGEWSPPVGELTGTVLVVNPSSEPQENDGEWRRRDGLTRSGDRAINSSHIFDTIADAVRASRASPKPTTIALRAGTHVVPHSGIQLRPEDSGLTIRNAPGERAVVSGGHVLRPVWRSSAACHNCVETDLSLLATRTATARGIDTGMVIEGLRRDGVREIRARYPNFDPELNMVDAETGKLLVHDGRNGLINQTAPEHNATQWITSGGAGTSMNGVPGPWPTMVPSPATHVVSSEDWPSVEWPMDVYNKKDGAAEHNRWTGEGAFGQFWLGVNGTCADRQPPAGYWCAPGAPRGISVPNHPAGMVLTPSQLPHLPYARPEGAIVHAWGKGHWYTNIFEIGSSRARASRNGSTEFDAFFSRGGTQGGEGTDAGAEWYIENVLEELDADREWYYDNRTSTLYYRPPANATSAMNAADGTVNVTGSFVAVTERVLFNVSGSQAAPVRDVRIFGLVLRDTAPSYFEPHGLPSGGDWALAQQGAVTLVGTERVSVEACLLTRLDGNGVFIGGYHRNLSLSDNDFEFLGGSAMAAWGQTTRNLDEAGSTVLPWPIGPDGRSGDQPRGTRVIGNTAREVGIWQKQSSAWFQAVTATTELSGNVFFNGPRAAVNMNDGFGGGDEVARNLLLNQVRESKDHGPYNQWDRVPYITNLRYANGTASIIPRDRTIHHNFAIGNYNSQEVIDTDDGSSYIRTFDNFFAYGGNGLKSDFGGHDHRWRGNVIAYAGGCFGAPMPFRYFHGYNNAFENNSCLTLGPGYGAGPYSSDCYLDSSWTVGGNRVFTATGNATVCGRNWTEWFGPGPAPVNYSVHGAAVPAAAAADFAFSGGAASAVSRDSAAGTDIRTGSPHQNSTAVVAHGIDACGHALESVTVEYQYVVGYGASTAEPPAQMPIVVLQLVDSRNHTSVVADALWRSPPASAAYSYDTFTGYSPPVHGEARGLGMGKGRCVAVALHFVNNKHNLQVKLDTLNVSVTWRAATQYSDARPGTSMNCSCVAPATTSDRGTTLARWPADEQLIGWASAMLNFSV